MPGRGQPWKGVGKGNPDRIGSGAIKDGSITEADLNSSVTAKLNTAGGHVIKDEGGVALPQRANLDFVGDGVVASDGIEDTTTITIAGGGGIDLLDTGLLREDFYWNEPDSVAFADKYRINGIVNVGGNIIDDNGVLNLASVDSASGSGANLNTEDGWRMSVELSDILWKSIISVNDIINQVVALGVMSPAPSTSGITTQANFFSGVTDGFGFVFDPSTSANWQIWTSLSGTQTVSTTSTAVVAGMVKLKITWTKGTQAVFNINGSDVGTITTNLPIDENINVIAEWNKIATQESIDIDLLEVQTERVPN